MKGRFAILGRQFGVLLGVVGLAFGYHLHRIPDDAVSRFVKLRIVSALFDGLFRYVAAPIVLILLGAFIGAGLGHLVDVLIGPRSAQAETLSAQRNRSVLLIHLGLAILSIVFLIPLLWMISTSLKPETLAMKDPPVWIPPQLQWHNYWDAVTYDSRTLGYLPFVVYFRNTILLCILVVAGTVVSNALVAYSFARLKWPGRDVAFAATLATMMVPFPITMVPLFALFRDLGWVGTYKPLWVPAWFGSAFSIFLLRQFFRTIPFELSEAATIDGCSEWQIFKDVVLPLAKPALAVVALLSFLATWNDFLGPLLYLLDQKTFTLAVGLQAYQSQAGGTDWNLLMAASTMVIAPIIILFFFTQRLFIQGIALTGLKG